MLPCRSCGTLITFAKIRTSDKLGPFEVDPDGDWTIDDGIALHVGKAGPQLELVAKPTSVTDKKLNHWPGTCSKCGKGTYTSAFFVEHDKPCLT